MRFSRAVFVYFYIRMLWKELRYMVRLSTSNLRWEKISLPLSIIIISVWPNVMAGTASPWWDVWCQVAVMMMLLSASFPGLGKSILNGAESLQESVLIVPNSDANFSACLLRKILPTQIQFVELKQRETVLSAFGLIIVLQLNHFE